MHILFLSQVLPYPLDAGPKMRSYFVLRHLTRTHRVTLLAFVRDTDTPGNIAHLAEFCHAVHTVPMPRSCLRDVRFLAQSLLTGQPFLILRDKVPQMVKKICQLVTSEQFDVIHSDQLWMAQYALIAREASPQARLILDQHNAVYLIPRRMAGEEINFVKQKFLVGESNRLAAYEVDVWRRFDQVVWVTEEDRQAVANTVGQSTNGHAPSTIIPICADPDQVVPLETNPDARRITFIGGLHWPPNAQGVLWFAQEVFPRIRAKIPKAILTVIGKNPPANLAREGIEVTGYVVDPTSYLAETAAFIVPLLAGGGMRVKILDAWSWALPIISTTLGAEGIEVSPGQDILIADEAEAFAQAVIEVMLAPELAQQLRQKGRETVMIKYNWQMRYADWDKVYQA